MTTANVFSNFDPTSLFAGAFPVRHRPVTIAQAGALARGMVLGRKSIGAVTSAAKSGGNTGTGTCVPDVTTPNLAGAQAGIYQFRCTNTTTGSAAATGTARTGNTGNATIGTVTPTAAAALGEYRAVFTAATAYKVYSPSGALLGVGATGSAFSAAGLGFTITAGGTPAAAGDEFILQVNDLGVSVFSVVGPNGVALSPVQSGTASAQQVKVLIAEASTKFIVGDGFDVTVAAVDKYISSVATAIDGSQIPSAILAFDIDTTAADVVGPVYFEGEFAAEKLTMDASWSITTLKAALRQNNSNLFVRSVGVLG